MNNNTEQKVIKDEYLELKSEEVLSNLFDIYLNKFDTLCENIDTAKIALSAYKERFSKINSKLDVIKSYFINKSQTNLEFFEKIEKLDSLDQRLSKIETRTQKLINKIIDAEKNVLEDLKSKSDLNLS